MRQNPANKILIISQISLIASLIGAIVIASCYYLKGEHTLYQFFYIAYIFFVNYLLMPVFISTALYYFMIKDDDLKNLAGRLKAIVYLSIIIFITLFFWNMIDIFLILNIQNIGIDSLLKMISKELFGAVVLSVPLAGLISFLYSLSEVIKTNAQFSEENSEN